MWRLFNFSAFATCVGEIQVEKWHFPMKKLMSMLKKKKKIGAVNRQIVIAMFAEFD